MTSYASTRRTVAHEIVRLACVFLAMICFALILFGWIGHETLESWIRSWLPNGVGLMGIVLLALLFLATSYIAIFLHELGHAIAGRVRGLRFYFLIIGRLAIACDEGRFRMRRIAQGRMLTGKCLSAPVNAGALRADLVWFYAGGPIGSILAAISGIGSAYALGPQSDLVASTFRLALAFTGINAALHVPQGIPLPPGIARPGTDGAHLWIIWRDIAGARSHLATLNLFGLSRCGVRPRDWPEHLLQDIANEPGASRNIYRQFQLAKYWDQGDMAEALRLSYEAVEEIDTMGKDEAQATALTHSYFVALLGEDSASARAWFERGRNAPIDKFRLLSAEAEVLIAEGEIEKAQTTLQQARGALKLALTRITDADRELLDDQEQRVLERLQLSSAARP